MKRDSHNFYDKYQFYLAAGHDLNTYCTNLEHIVFDIPSDALRIRVHLPDILFYHQHKQKRMKRKSNSVQCELGMQVIRSTRQNLLNLHGLGREISTEWNIFH